MRSAIAADWPEVMRPLGEEAAAPACAAKTEPEVTVDIPAASLVSSPGWIGRRPPYVGGPRSTNTMPRSVRLPRFFSSCTKWASAKATRRSKPVLNVLSGLPGRGLRDSQNFSTNSARSPPDWRLAQVFFSSAVMIHCSGPLAQFSSGGSLEFGGSLNSWKALKSDPDELGIAGGAACFFANSKAATAFFE